MNRDTLIKIVIESLEDSKANDIKNIDVTHLTDVVDNVVVCSATSTRHASSIADKLVKASKENGVRPLGMEGEAEGEWILIDLHDAVVHIMLPDAREYYDIEKLWSATESFRQQNES